MDNTLHYKTAQKILLDAVTAVGTEYMHLSQCGGRILATDLVAVENIPAFDRSPYDGYALRASDTLGASMETPVTLRIVEEIPAGAVSTQPVVPGTAAKVLTGAPIPNGADTVIMFEKTVFSAERVTVFAPQKAGDNIVRTGEDVRQGTVLAWEGTRIDPGLAGTLELSDGTVSMRIPGDQGNTVLSSAIGCNVMAEVPAGSDKLSAGTVLKGFLL